ncbi:hypothetical protein J42TS3_19580 [Paenibacillus vini]|uniref:DUF2180 domain-containing protein n=1 Tax=Paenibacillus vini TaxID=1476024 RepID=A0ABQ4MAA1_9BACL|nr:hypothetical protein J42TS3_19580 [Paenibacillus vini]
MKCCTFCSKNAEMLFIHPVHEIGRLCARCYLQLQGSCGTCGGSFLLTEIKENVSYQVRAKFIGMGEKNYVVCFDCFDAIQHEFSQKFE